MSKTKRVLVCSAAGILLVASAGFYWIWSAPCALGGCAPLEELADLQTESSLLLDLDGEPFAQLAGVNRRAVSLDSLPPHVPLAFIAIEDRRFYEHQGIDFRRTAGAFLSNILAGRISEGASTITQQLARNLFPGSLPPGEKSVRRKVLEARVARQIERTLPKDSILELYLNQIYLGNGAYGIEAAAQVYFGKRATELNLAEAAALGAIPQTPAEVNPIDDGGRAKARRDLVLDQMMHQGYISPAANQLARAQPMPVLKTAGGGSIGPYFVDAVRRELEETVGDRFYTAGLKIYTTLDRGAQRAAEEELERQLSAIESGVFGPYAHPRYVAGMNPDDHIRYLQGAVVVIDAATGEIRALVGGRDHTDSQFNRATRALRQPGSAFKPFIFAVALERFRSPAYPVDNSRLSLEISDGEVWEPKNLADDYEGPITMRDALARSSNTATVRLSRLVGLDAAIQLAHDLGITSEIQNLPAIALGAAVVRPIELIAAYAAFANGGARVQPHLIRRIVDRQGRVVWDPGPRRDQVLEPSIAFVLTSMLEDALNRGTGLGVRTAGFRGVAAGKTGTTNKGADAWFVGYTPDLVAGVWIGLDYPKPILPDASGEILAAPAWGRIMSRIYEGRPRSAGWRVPRGVVRAQVSAATNSVVTSDCPVSGPVYLEYFVGDPPRSRGCVAAAAPAARPATTPLEHLEQAVADAPILNPRTQYGVLQPADSSSQVVESVDPNAGTSRPAREPVQPVRPPGAETAPRPSSAPAVRRPSPVSPAELPGIPQLRLLGLPTQGDSASLQDSPGVQPVDGNVESAPPAGQVNQDQTAPPAAGPATPDSAGPGSPQTPAPGGQTSPPSTVPPAQGSPQTTLPADQ